MEEAKELQSYRPSATPAGNITEPSVCMNVRVRYISHGQTHESSQDAGEHRCHMRTHYIGPRMRGREVSGGSQDR